MKKIALVFAYGQHEDGSLSEQTQSRCEAAFQLYLANSVEKIFITNATVKNSVSMGEKMAEYLIQKGVPERDAMLSKRGYNTAGEIDACLDLLKEEVAITAVSSWYHLPRIWFLFRVRGRSVKLAASYGGVARIDLIMEPLKIANSLLRPFSSSKLMKI